jgi:hypothetical protein
MRNNKRPLEENELSLAKKTKSENNGISKTSNMSSMMKKEPQGPKKLVIKNLKSKGLSLN